MKNEPKIIRERKQSLNKHSQQFSQYAHRQGRPRISSSLPKKIQTTSSISKIQTRTQGSYLFAWGQSLAPHLSFSINPKQSKKLGRNIIKYSLGEKHLIYLNQKHEVFGQGSSHFGQLGYFSNEQKNEDSSIALMEGSLTQEIFCTPYCTFLLTSRDQVYGCGLNNRGQLGIGSSKSISIPTKIIALSRRSFTSGSSRVCDNYRRESLEKKNSTTRINRINSVALAEKTQNTNQSKLITEQFSEESASFCLLQENEYIISIEGGPYHTIALTNNGRVFYSGNIYKKSTIINDEFTINFTQLNLKKIGKVQKIRAGLTSIGLLNTQGNLFILGALSQNIICDEPYSVGIACTVDFCFMNNKIGVINSLGELYLIIQNKKSLRTLLLNNKKKNQKFQEITGGNNKIYCTNDKGQIFMFDGENLEEKQEKNIELYLKAVSEELLPLYGLKSNGSYCLILSERPELYTPQIYKSRKKSVSKLQNTEFPLETLKKIQGLEKQNEMLKELLRKKSSEEHPGYGKNIERISFKDSTTDCATLSKFQINNRKIAQKARTFEYSMEIPFEEIQLGKQISEGGYGIIYKGKWRKTTVAVKIFKIDENSENSIKDFISQCHAMEALRHPNIVMFLGACTKPPTFAIVLEYCEGGTLWSILQRSGEVPWQQRRKFAIDIAKGMNYLHQRTVPILHRDLKSLNILLDANKQIKLADFGWTKGLQNYMTGKIGTYQWMAPQVVSSHQYTEKADVFSFGIILWEIASREAPYRNIPGVQVAHDVLHKDLRPPIPRKAPQNFINLMKRCWSKNPEDRPSFNKIIDELEIMQLPQ